MPDNVEEKNNSESILNGGAAEKVGKSKKRAPTVSAQRKKNYWPLKITLISFLLAAFISFLSNLASTGHIVVMVLLLIFLIFCSILFDGIGVAVTACELAPLAAMASKRVYGAKTAFKLVKNAEKVSNICNDVVGDILGIVSGTCTVVIVWKLLTLFGGELEQLLTIIFSSIVGTLTIGGKAYLKQRAITNSKNFVMFVARFLAVFNRDERKKRDSR
ncbi:MAG TPA: Mg2+ and Co2+ transporter CorB [Eubacteriales bacterium]|nr:Mg2+ and Co2+ transporter CorB [Eubacteriales bacterium]